MIIIAVDPGLGGACAVKWDSHVTVFDTPVYTTKTGKKDFSLKEMAQLLDRYSLQQKLNNTKVVFIIENVHALPGNGGTSMFNFGRGKGIWEGMAVAFEFVLLQVTPQKWKSQFPELLADKPAKRKDKTPLSSKEKAELAKAKRLAKAGAKARARTLAGELYPSLKDKFEMVKSDGRAEAVLIAHYAEAHIQELLNG